MKRKDLDTMKSITKEELAKKISELELSLAQILRERYTKQSKNVREAKAVRKSLAQAQTLLREKELLA